MSYLTPFYLSLEPGEKNLYHTYILNDEPGIPDDTYQLQEWYCPNPTCHCYEVSLKVYAIQQKVIATDLRLSLDPQKPIAPILDMDDSFPIYAKKLFKFIEQELMSNPEYVQRLRDHYQHSKMSRLTRHTLARKSCLNGAIPDARINLLKKTQAPQTLIDLSKTNTIKLGIPHELYLLLSCAPTCMTMKNYAV